MPCVTRLSRMSGVQPIVSSTFAYGRALRGAVLLIGCTPSLLVATRCHAADRGRVAREPYRDACPHRHAAVAALARREAQAFRAVHGGSIEVGESAALRDEHTVDVAQLVHVHEHLGLTLHAEIPQAFGIRDR